MDQSTPKEINFFGSKILAKQPQNLELFLVI